MIVPSGGSAGRYVVTWNGHGDAMGLWKVDPVNGTLSLANSWTYSTWGAPTLATHDGHADLGFSFLYVGEFDVQWDNALGLGLTYMHARHYSPALGRFLQPDPDRSEANLYAYAANNPVTEMDPDGTCFIVCQVLVGALIDAVVYAATTDDFSLDGLAGAVVTGAVESAVNPLAKLGKISKVATAADKLLSKVPKANRVAAKMDAAGRWRTPDGRFAANPNARPSSTPVVHGNSLASDRVTYLYKAYSKTTGEFQKWGITANPKGRYSSSSDLRIVIQRQGTRRDMATLERRVVSRFGGPLNGEPWSASRRR